MEKSNGGGTAARGERGTGGGGGREGGEGRGGANKTVVVAGVQGEADPVVEVEMQNI